VVQHARATEVEVSIFETTTSEGASRELESIMIEIVDNGVGVQPGAPVGGHGTRNMNSRAEAIGADLRFDVRESGRSVILRIPVASLG
jgi:signal transduction histidine kinase